MSTIGVLALQGAFVEHVAMLQRLGAAVRLVTLPEHLEQVDGLIIPGGESTTIGKLMVEWKLLEPLRSLGSSGFPIFGSCAGAIVLAKHAGREQPLLHLMDLSVARNAFGRQVDSFEAELNIPALGNEPFHGIFIRAPKLHPRSEDVEVLCRLQDGTVVAARQHNLLAVSFHAELTEDSRLHRYFLNSIGITQGGDLRVAPPDQDRAVTAEI
ncbi:MAG: pyridoxal 5'-phosphate synthase glutaminase subunit PdxT [Chloroflexi bacterium]|nr:pyridoxal 5'-phosphate synthase glutaminase subunit PdxT [Chloroflexota bacterium]